MGRGERPDGKGHLGGGARPAAQRVRAGDDDQEDEEEECGRGLDRRGTCQVGHEGQEGQEGGLHRSLQG